MSQCAPLPNLRPDRQRCARLVLLCAALCALLLLLLLHAGGMQAVVEVPSGFHYGVNSLLDSTALLLPHALRAGWQQGLLLARAVAAGALLCWYFLRHFAVENRMLPVLCTSYAANVYTAGSIDVIWVDAALLLPLLLDAADGLLRQNNRLRFGLAVFACVLFNCYTAWPLCAAALGYLAWQWFSLPGRADWPGFGRLAKRAVGNLALAAGLAFVCLLPTLWRSFQSGAFRFSHAVKPVAFTPVSLVYCLFFGRYALQSANTGLPYLYTGTAALVLALLFFFGTATTRRKFASVFFVAAVMASYLLEMPGLEWRSGTDVTVFPFRYGFLCCALVLLFAADTLVGGGPPRTSVMASMVLCALWAAGLRANAGAAFRWNRLFVGGALCVAAGFLLLVRDRRPAFRQAASLALAVLLAADVYASSCITLYGVLKL